jgi:hypothetical protein
MNDKFPSSAQDANAKVHLTWGLKALIALV